jgi:subtilisin family serine protease
MLFVASAGQTNSSVPQYGNNDDYAHYPSNFNSLPNVISVTAISQKGVLSESSLETANYGKNSVDLGAPGSSIVSTYLPTISPYSAKTGTSMAAPFVSGAAALLFSVPGCSSLTPNAAKQKIIEGTVYTAGLAGKTSTDGRLNVFNAISPCARVPKNRRRVGRSLNQ